MTPRERINYALGQWPGALHTVAELLGVSLPRLRAWVSPHATSRYAEPTEDNAAAVEHAVIGELRRRVARLEEKTHL